MGGKSRSLAAELARRGGRSGSPYLPDWQHLARRDRVLANVAPVTLQPMFIAEMRLTSSFRLHPSFLSQLRIRPALAADREVDRRLADFLAQCVLDRQP